MKIIDSLIKKSNSWANVKLTHKKVTTVGYNDREEPSFEDSVIETTSFNATESEAPDYNSDVKYKSFGVINQELKVYTVPSDKTFNKFVSEGVRDRILVQGDVVTEYEVFSVDIDRVWRQTMVTIFIRPLTP